MRFRLGIAAGLATGYVLGTKAGRERYEQIKRAWGKLTGSPAVHRATERASEVAGHQAKRALYAVQSGVGKAGSAVKDRLGHETDSTVTASDAPAAPATSGGSPETPPGAVQDASQG